MPEPRQLLINLLDYIREQSKKINPGAYNVANSNEFVCRPSDLSLLPGIELDVRGEEDHVWLRIQRLQQESPPKASADWQEVLKVSRDPAGFAPSLDEAKLTKRISEEIARIQEPVEELRLAEVDRISANFRESAARALESYSAIWQLWAVAELPRRKTIDLYGSLYTLRQQMESEQTSKPKELVWGMGVASWRLSYDGKPVGFQYPLLTQALELSVHDQSMAIEVRPRAVDIRLEFDAFFACKAPGADECEKTVLKHFAKSDRSTHPFDPSSYSHLLKMIAGNLDSQGEFRQSLTDDSFPSPGANLVVTDGWVILSRERSTHFLFEDLKRLQNALTDGCEIPPGPLSLVTEPSNDAIQFETVNFRGISSRGDSSGGTPKELFFPLPYNDEQVTIVHRLDKAPGVTVQGPPGTGKTHTIANIICHYLASGKRVLVTSKGEPALREVRDKLPAEIRDLAVALLASDQEGMRQFQASIGTIQHRVSQLNEGISRPTIQRLQSSIDRAHAELIAIDRRVDKIAMDQLSEVEVDGELMRAHKLAEIVVHGQGMYSWFDDALSLDPQHSPPLTAEDSNRLRAARRLLGKDLEYIHATIPAVDNFPAPPKVGQLHEDLLLRDSLNREKAADAFRLRENNSREFNELVGQMLQMVDSAMAVLADLESLGEVWPQGLREECRNSAFSEERAALEALLDEGASLAAARGPFLKSPITFPETGFDSLKTLEAVERAASTGKPFRLIDIGATEAKEHIRAIRISGKLPSSVEDWAHVRSYTVLNEQVRSFTYRWNEMAKHLSLPPLSGGIFHLQKISTKVELVRKIHAMATRHDPELISLSRQVFATELFFAEMDSRVRLEAVRSPLLRYVSLAKLRNAEIQLARWQELLAGKSGPIARALRSFLETEIGDKSKESQAIAATFAGLLAELRRIAALQTELDFVRRSAQRIGVAGAPKLAQRLSAEAAPSYGDDRVFPANWREAWNWARMKSHLLSIDAKDELRVLAERRTDAESALAKLYRDMVAEAAWLATKRNATPRILSALNAYATAVYRIGRGTGPNAMRYRRDARNAMQQARAAIPCWIMDHNRISESMPAEIGSFDLIIVDEASQSDLWALPAILRGKKILVVGDDKQVSPDAGFIRSDNIDDLLRRFLSDQWFKEEMTPEKSLYDLAARVFAANQVMLREHFRCVEPIIAYSNGTFYKGQIQPLRIARPSERLDPPLIDLFVEGGVRNGRECNEEEARAIADEIGSSWLVALSVL
jgi:hypothetical protein